MRRFSKIRHASISMIIWALLPFSGIILHSHNATSAETTDIPLVGKNHEGRSQVVFIPEEQYLDKMSSTLLAVNDGVIPQLSQRSCEIEKHTHFELTTVTVAIGIEFQVGLGALFSVSTGGKMELVYANQFDPVIPE